MSLESFKFKSISKTATEDNEIEGALQKIVNVLASILEKCLPKKKYSEIESLFDKSGSLVDMLYNIETMSVKISESIGKNLSVDKTQSTNHANDENYLNLEKMVQKYEAEIRDHIRMEQQLGIYTQSLEEEIDALKLNASNKSSNEKTIDQINALKVELDKLRNEKSTLEHQLKRSTRAEFTSSNTSVLGKINTKSVEKNIILAKANTRLFKDLRHKDSNNKTLASLSKRKNTKCMGSSDKNILNKVKQNKDENVFKYSALLLNK